MDTDSSQNILISKLDTFLREKSSEKALSLVNNNEFKEVFQSNSSDLVPLLGKHISENIEQNPEMVQCCEELLLKASMERSSIDLLIELIEQAEECDLRKFIIMINPMKICLLRIEENWGNCVQWIANTALRQLGQTEAPEVKEMEGDEKILLENDPSVLQIREALHKVVELFEATLEEANKRNDSTSVEYVTKSLLKVLGKPTVFLDLSLSTPTKNDSRILVERILEKLLELRIDPLRWLEGCHSNTQSMEGNEENESCLESDFENTSLGVCFYLIYHEEICINKIPQVYHPLYVLEKCAILALVLLGFLNPEAQIKGLNLVRGVLKRVDERGLMYEAVDKKFWKLVESVVGILNYSDSRENRLAALDIFKTLVNRLDSKGRYVLLLNVQDLSPTPGFLGFVATQVKDIVAGSLQGNPDSEVFTGKKLIDLVLKCCSLPEGAKTDLAQNSDWVISGLNLARFLALREPRLIGDFAPTLSSSFLTPLKEALDLSKAHYNLKKTDIASKTKRDEVDLTISGVTLPEMTADQKQHVLDLALNTFDLIESLLSRVNECLELCLK